MDREFAGEFLADKIFMVDYSDGEINPLLEKFSEYGCDSYVVTNDKQDYLDALETALGSFKNNWHLIIWTIIFTTIMVLCGFSSNQEKLSDYETISNCTWVLSDKSNVIRSG